MEARAREGLYDRSYAQHIPNAGKRSGLCRGYVILDGDLSDFCVRVDVFSKGSLFPFVVDRRARRKKRG